MNDEDNKLSWLALETCKILEANGTPITIDKKAAPTEILQAQFGLIGVNKDANKFIRKAKEYLDLVKELNEILPKIGITQKVE